MLDVPAIRAHALAGPYATLCSMADYHQLGDRLNVELLGGVVVKKTPNSPHHRKIARRLAKILKQQIAPEFEVWKHDPLSFAESEPEPDLAVVRAAVDEYASAHPHTAELVVEVAITSLEIDRVKALIYAEAGVKEYWIVRPAERVIDVYREPLPSGYARVTSVSSTEILTCDARPEVQVKLSDLFA